MNTPLLAVLTFGMFLVADVPKDNVKKEKEKLQGTWKAIKVEEKGQSKDEDKEHRLIFSGDEFTIEEGSQAIIKGKFKIDPSKAPKEIDFEIIESRKEVTRARQGSASIRWKATTFNFAFASRATRND